MSDLERRRERALAEHRRGDLAAAERAYRELLEKAPGDGPTWHYLAVLNGQRDDHAASELCCRRAIEAGFLSPSVFGNLALALARQGRRVAAAGAIRRGLALEPVDREAALALVQQLRDLGFERSALDALRRLHKRFPGDVEVLDGLARSALQLGSVADAGQALQALVQLEPRCLDHRVNLAHYFFMTGRAADSEAAAMDALAIDRGCSEAWHLLARVADLAADDPRYRELLRRAAEAPGMDSPPLQFAAGWAQDRAGATEAAFACFERGNRLVRSGYDYDVAADEKAMAIIAERVADTTPLPGAVDEAWARPLFVVGMPRSGSTLLETLLLRCPGVASAGEHLWFQRLARDALRERNLPFPEGMWALPDDALRSLREAYLALLGENADAAGPVTHCIDKLPANLLYLPLILRLFPSAPVLITSRDCVATSLSCFMHLFSGPQRFAYDLSEALRFCRAQEAILAASRELPSVCTVPLHSLQRQQDQEMKRVTAHCGLPHPVPESDERAMVRTASALQVSEELVGADSAAARYAAQIRPLLSAVPPQKR